MSKKIYNTLIDEAYDLYADSHFIPPKNPNGKLLSDQLFSVIPMEHSKETFVIECKKNPKFSKKWGLKIEEMELVQRERIKLLHNAWKDNGILPEDDEVSTLWIDYKNLMIKYNIPTKKITVTYKDEIIEFYE
jgi:hypothetical protein